MNGLPTLVQGNVPEDIWNEDETFCFFHALPERTVADAKKGCKGGKKAKQRITLAFIVNAPGGEELPIVYSLDIMPPSIISPPLILE